MERVQKQKKIKKCKKKVDVVKFVCDLQSDSEGYELLYYERSELPIRTHPLNAPAIKPNQSQDLPQKESQNKEKKQPTKPNKATIQPPYVSKQNTSTKIKQEKSNNHKPIKEQVPNNHVDPNVPPLLNFQSQILPKDKKQQIPIEDTLPKRFSQTLKSSSIYINPTGNYASVETNGREGYVLIDFPIKHKVSWQLRVQSPSLSASLGICQRRMNQSEKHLPIQNIITVDTNSQEDGFFFENGHIIRITFNPFTKTLAFFNTCTSKAKKLTALSKIQGFQYYPYVYLYKATVTLTMQWLINKIKEQKQQQK